MLSSEQTERSLSKLEADGRPSSGDDKQFSVNEDEMVREKYAKVYERHGRIDLDPLPSDAPDDPLNWSFWRKDALLWIVSFHAMQGPFGLAMLIPGFGDLAHEFGVSIIAAAYITSVPIVFLGTMPLFWSPISARIGRRPVYLISSLASAVCALASVFCHSYGTLMATRILQAAFISPPLTIGACTIQELFFAHQKGQKMGVWVMMFTLGPPLGPLIAGYMVQSKGWRSSMYLLAAIHLGLFFSHLFLGPETMYPNRKDPGEVAENAEQQSRDWWRQYVQFEIYDHTPIRVIEFVKPLFMIARPLIFLSIFGFSIDFGFTSLLMTIFVPQVFGTAFNLSPGQIGLQFISLIIGAVLGEQLAGRGSDFYVNRRTRQTGKRRPEYRLVLSYPGFILSIVGLITWGVQLHNAKLRVWNVTPDVGSAIATFGQQLVSTICTTYAVESYITETADVSAFIVFFRQLWVFIAPFYLGPAFTNMGAGKAAGLFAATMALGMLMVIACHIWGPKWRGTPRS